MIRIIKKLLIYIQILLKNNKLTITELFNTGYNLKVNQLILDHKKDQYSRQRQQIINY